MLTKSDLEQIKNYLALYGKKDSQLETVPVNLDYPEVTFEANDYLSVVQGSKNKTIKIKDLEKVFLLTFLTDEDFREALKGKIPEEMLENACVTTEKLADGAVTTIKLGTNAVTTAKIATGAITNEKIANNTIQGSAFAANSITSDKIVDGTVTGDKLADGSIQSVDIKDNTLSGSKFVDGSISGSKIQDDVIESKHLLDNSIPASKIKDGSIESIDIKDGTLDGAKIKDNTIESVKLANNAVTADKIIDNSVTTNKIANNSVTTDKIVDGAITESKLGTGAVTTAKINNGAVTTDKIPNNNITTAKIDDGAVTSDKIPDNAIITSKIADANVTTGKIANGAVTEDKLADGAITTDKIADSTITELTTIMDTVPTEGSVKPVTSGGIKAYVDAKTPEVVPMAQTLEAWADQKAIATPDTYTDAVRTTGGDIPIETSAGSKPESIKPVAGSKWTAKLLFNGSYNMLNAAKWGAANSQPNVGGVGSDFVYFLVPKLTLGTFGTADENNGLLFTDSEGENVEPTSVYFKPLGATVPSSLTDGTSITPTSVSYDGKTYKDYATDSAGWLIIPKSYYDNDVCAHIAWEDWYDKHVSLNEPNTNPEAVVGILILEGLLALAHSDKYLRGVNNEVCDNVVFGDTSATITHMVDELSVAAASWTNAATGESDSQGNALYRHSATVSGIKQGGAACVEGEDGGIPLTVNGTTVSYVDTNATAPASMVFYEVTATSTTKAYTDSVFTGSNINTETGILPINDCSIEAQVAMDGKADITVKYAKNIVDQVAINATVDVPQIKHEVEEHEERITNLEDTAVRTNSYDASVSVGLADNLRGDTIVEAEFYKRKTGGIQSVGSGITAIKEVKGKSIVWNQYYTNTKVRTFGCTYEMSGNNIIMTNNANTGEHSTSITGEIVSRHKYYLKFTIENLDDAQKELLLGFAPSSGYVISPRPTINGNETSTFKYLITAPNNFGTRMGVREIMANGVLKWRGQCFDLTLMFGAGNEPATIAEFEKIFPLDYYDYNAGEVIPFAGQNLTTIGKNQYNPATGKANLLGGQTYQISGTYTTLYPTVTLIDYTYGDTVAAGTYYTNGSNHFVGAKTVNTYDNTATYTLGAYCVNNDTIYKSNVAIETAEEFDATHWDAIVDVAAMVTEGIFTLWDITPDANGLFTLTKDTEVTVVGGNDTNTFIGFYNGEDNTYEPYEKHTLPLDPSQWRDKQGNLVFPYGGMHGVGTAYDYAKVDADGYIRSVVRCFGQVDLGTLTWGIRQVSGTRFFASAFSNAEATNNGSAICSKYILDHRTPNLMKDKSFNIQYWTANQAINILDSSYTDAATFKAAMQGILLFYKLTTPVEVELATPVYAKYLVDKDGTEEISPANGSTPYTTIANLSIIYAMDARGEIKNLPKNYLSKESAESMLNAMVTAGIIASYTMTWDATNSRYSFVITAPVEPEENNS